tara:strand:- start:43873 stop:44205 length:333 start_codon:yes stop_codon:yes gene_type:complete
MKERFARLQDRLHRVVEARLSDSLGCYQQGGELRASDLSLQVDREWGDVGAAEAFGAQVRFVTWRKSRLAHVERGGVFLVDELRLTVERTLSDDGHYMTAACLLEQLNDF